jgi:hypothetical protein
MTDTPRNRALAFIEKCDDPDKLAQVAANAAHQGYSELEKAALLKLYSILPKHDKETVEHDVWQSVYALEGELKRERGKTVLLSRTRQKIDRDGELKTVSDLVAGKASKGFAMLIERGMSQRTFEALTLRHPDDFDEETRAHAAKRLADAGILTSAQ